MTFFMRWVWPVLMFQFGALWQRWMSRSAEKKQMPYVYEKDSLTIRSSDEDLIRKFREGTP